jgi:tetratricopeptide (TPR) repeat protein
VNRPGLRGLGHLAADSAVPEIVRLRERAWHGTTIRLGERPEGDQVTNAGTQVALAERALRAGEVDDAATKLSAAVREFTAAGDRRRAAMTCARLGDLFAVMLGNLTAARSWFIRAIRLLEAEPPCIEQGWVAVAALGCDVDDPAVLLCRAELALDRARRFGDVNLEMLALANAGLAHVQAGRLAEGRGQLDEAMALACGPADDVEAAGKSVCSFLTACYFTADFDRAGSWADMLRGRGLIGTTAGVPVFLGNHCDSVHATALCELGRWVEAEAVLVRAIDAFEACMGIPSWHPAIALAELRMRQGRLAEAEMLLLGKDGHLQALLPAARLHQVRGDHDLARATATRGLRAIGADRLRAAELLAVLVDTELDAGNLDAAARACDELVARADQLDVAGLQARVAAARAHVLAAKDDIPAALGMVENALDRLPNSGMPLLRATLLLALVHLHDRAGNRAAATVEARSAVATLTGLDVVLAAVDVALLERVGVPAPGVRRAALTATLRRDDRGWVAECGFARSRLRDTKGLRYLAELLRNPGLERHALDLVDRVEGMAADDTGVDRRRLGDAGELLDGRARIAYRHRIEALRVQIDEALAAGADEDAHAHQGELDELVDQLAQAFGLGGRARRASSAAERARVNVTRALRAATAALGEALPEAGTVLDARLRTGLYCAYEPDDSDDVRWVVQS